MNLTNAQRNSLKAAILADPTANAFPNTSDGNFDLAIYCNATGAFAPSAAVNVWLPLVPVMPTLNGAIVWRTYATLTPALQNAYIAMTQSGSIDMTDPQVARGMCGLSGQTDGVFVDGSASAVNIKAASQRAATRIEGLWSNVGTGTLSSANVCQKDKSGATLFGQQIDYQTLLDVRSS